MYPTAFQRFGEPSDQAACPGAGTTSPRAPGLLLVALGSLVLLVSNVAAAAALPVQEERLGAWHYLLPLESKNYDRTMTPPTAVEFGAGRIAVILPGSEKVAEFKAGAFDELVLPRFESPLSLAVDRQGKLYCLLERSSLPGAKGSWRERRVTAWTDGIGWGKPESLPLRDADRLDFDTQNRLWALGHTPAAAVRDGARWHRYRDSDGPRLNFARLYLAPGNDGEVLLFSYLREDWSPEAKRFAGALIYRDGRFTHDPHRDVSALREEQGRKEAALGQDDFGRPTGYVCHAQALNTHREGLTTVLRAGGYVLVSLANEGLAWANATTLQTTPALDENAEWERIEDVAVPPTAAPDGTLWVVRDNPRRLVRVGREGEQEFPAADLPGTLENGNIELDQLGRPWVLGWRAENGVACLRDGVIKVYDSLPEALKAESSVFQAGRVFPGNDLVVKTPAGAFCLLDYEIFTIFDAEVAHSYDDEQISPGHTKRIVLPRHGYSPFREGRPVFDAQGRIYTAVDGEPFRYRAGSWRAVRLSATQRSELRPAALPAEPGDVLGEDETRLRAPDDHQRVFRRLHFYEKAADGQLEAIDHGLNPLAYYPFWSGWYESPGMTPPRVDPTGRIWLSSVGPYAQNHVWMRLREGR